MSSFPSSPDQLTAQWLTTTLGYTVDDFEVVYFGEGTGVMSWVPRILLDTEADNPSSLIAKFPPAVPWPKQKPLSRRWQDFTQAAGNRNSFQTFLRTIAHNRSKEWKAPTPLAGQSSLSSLVI